MTFVFNNHVYKTTSTGPRTERHEITCNLLTKFFKPILILSFILQTPNTNKLSMIKQNPSMTSYLVSYITFNKIYCFILEMYFTWEDLQMSK
jgi:hypothetical protein